jgi:Protein of unknown function (DUF3592)
VRKRSLLAVGLFLYVAILLAIVLGSDKLLKYRRISKEGKQVRGAVTAYEPRNHNTLRYIFEVNGLRYAGVDRGPGNSREAPSPGDSVEVCYVPDDPGISILGNGEHLFRNELIMVAVMSLIISGICTTIAMLTCFKPR